MRIDGSQVQNEIYISGESTWPIGADAWEAKAREVLDEGPFGYIAGGAGSESTIRANLEAFERRRLRPRMLTGNVERDLSVDVLGTPSPVPFFLAPVGVLSIAHAEGELAAARAAERVPAVSERAGLRTVLHRPRLLREARPAAGRGRPLRSRDDACDVSEPEADLGRPRVATGANSAAAAREGRADRGRRATRAGGRL